MKTLHIISDFRQDDWENRTAAANEIRNLDEASVKVNLVRSVPEAEAQPTNLSINSLTGEVQVAAAAIPIQFHADVENHSEVLANDVRISVFQDGQKLPMTLRVAKIPPGQSEAVEFDVTFKEAGKHHLELTLESDSLDADNRRFIVLDIKPSNPVLIIDGNPAGTEGRSIADALAANPKLTGFSPLVETPDYIRKHPLDQFQSIYLLNVSELKPDAIEYLSEYVKHGGGLAWFMGDAVKPAFYNDKLYNSEEMGLFPIMLGDSRVDLEESNELNPGPDLKFSASPIFNIFEGEDNPFVESVQIESYLPVADDWNRDDNKRKDGVATIARLRNNQPFMFEHQLGEGTIFTCLSSGGTSWNQWAVNPSYVIFMLELERHIARNDQAMHARLTGSAIELSMAPADYTGEVEILSPGEKASRSQRINAKQEVKKKPVKDGKKGTEEDDIKFTLSFGDANTDRPGVYRIKKTLTGGDVPYEEEWLAFNVASTESDMAIASDTDIRNRVGKDVEIGIQAHGSSAWLEGQEVGQEIRRMLLIFLVILFMLEQFMAYRLSFHTRNAPARPRATAAGRPASAVA